MPLDLTDISDEDFDNWLQDKGDHKTGVGLNDERLVELVSTTLRETVSEARALALVELANLCYAMADKALGSLAPSTRCLEIVVSVAKHH